MDNNEVHYDDFFEGYHFKPDENIENYPDVGYLFMTDTLFNNRQELLEWVKEVGKNNDMYFAIKTSRRGNGLGIGRVYIGCERSGPYRYNVPSPDKKFKPRYNTSTKRNCCPFELLGAEQVGGKWKLLVDVNKSKHNHTLGKYKQWHTSAAKLSTEEFEKVAHFKRSNMKPKQMLKQIQLENPKNVSGRRHIDNALQKIKRKQMGDLSPMQYFFKLLKDYGYHQWHRKEDGTNAVGDVLFAHPKAVDLLRLFPHVIIIDVTYRTNMYDVPLLEVIGVSSTGQNFHVAFGFMRNEKTTSFLWAMQRVKELFGSENNPGVVVTDREWALMNAVEHVFPSSAHLLCKRHIAKDVERYVTDVTGNKIYAKAFSIRWKKIVDSLTEEEYNVAVAEMVCAWSPNLSTVVDYVHKIWLDPYKKRFVSAWTKTILHFGARTTNRVESAHSQMKNWLGTATGAFHVIFPRIHDLVEMQLNEIKAEMEKSRTKSLHITRYQLFSRLKCKVSHHAISLLKNEYNDRCKKIGTNAEACGCEMRNSYGLPCAHEMCELMNTYTPIDLLDVHIFWKTLDMEGRNFQEKEGLRQTSSQRIDELVAMMKQYPPDQQYFFANAMYNILFPESTNLKEPIHRPHKGRPKHNPTKRDKSGWEHSEKNATKGSKKKQNSNKDSKQDADKKSKEPKKKKSAKESHTEHVSTSQNKSKDPIKEKRAKESCTGHVPTSQKKSKGQKKTTKSTRYSFPWPCQLPEFILPYVEGHINVRGDGHCGFRAIATFEYGDENKWLDVRRDLQDELTKHVELYRDREALGSIQEYNRMLDVVNCDKCPAPFQNWYDTIGLSMVVATRYQRIVTSWSKDQSVTFLPLETRLVDQPPSIYINLAYVWSNHYISLHMPPNIPLPPIFSSNIHNGSSDVQRWASTIFKDQLDLYRQLNGDK